MYEIFLYTVDFNRFLRGKTGAEKRYLKMELITDLDFNAINHFRQNSIMEG